MVALSILTQTTFSDHRDEFVAKKVLPCREKTIVYVLWRRDLPSRFLSMCQGEDPLCHCRTKPADVSVTLKIPSRDDPFGAHSRWAGRWREWKTACSGKVTLTDNISQWQLQYWSISKHSSQLLPHWRVINSTIFAWLWISEHKNTLLEIWRPHDRHWQTSPPWETPTGEGMNIFTFLPYLCISHLSTSPSTKTQIMVAITTV